MEHAVRTAVTKTKRTRNRWERSASGFSIIFRLRGRGTLPRNQQKNCKQIRALILPDFCQVNEIQSSNERRCASGRITHLHSGLAIGDLLYDFWGSRTINRVGFPREQPLTS